MDFRAVLLEQTSAFGDLISGADPATPVPTCPGWTVKQLFRHVGRGHRWAAQIVDGRYAYPPELTAVPDGRPPDDPVAAQAWLVGGAQLLVDAVERHGADVRVWTLIGSRPAGWWIRRRLHETVVHRADAALALGAAFELPAELAADGVGEWIDLMTARPARKPAPLEPGQSIHLHATDDGLGPTGEWTVVNDEDGLGWSHSHRKSSVALRGPARDVLLAVSGRVPAAGTGVEVFGDTAVWGTWLERTAF